MNNFLSRYYHWVALGVATLAVLVTLGFLTIWYLGLGTSFTALSDATHIPKSSPPQPSTSALDALKALLNPIFWEQRADGASPLVSRAYILKDGALIDPMEGDVPLYPPVPNKWLVDHHLDYTDQKILDRDPGHKGFTIKDEYLAGTDPNNPHEYPPLYTRLNYSDSDVTKNNYTLEFIDTEIDDGGKTEFELRPLQPIPNPTRGNRPDTSSRYVVKGDSVPGAPFLKVIDYQVKKKTINDTTYDVSELTLTNTITGDNLALTKKYGARDYKPTPIAVVESVTFHYQLAGAPEEIVTAERGKEFTLGSLDKKFTEIYKLNDFSNGEVILSKGGKTFPIKEQNASPAPTPSPTP